MKETILELRLDKVRTALTSLKSLLPHSNKMEREWLLSRITIVEADELMLHNAVIQEQKLA